MQLYNNTFPTPTEILTVEVNDCWHDWLEFLMCHVHDKWEEDLLLTIDGMTCPIKKVYMDYRYGGMSSGDFWKRFNQIVHKTKNLVLTNDLINPSRDTKLSDISRAWISGYKGLDEGCFLHYGECAKHEENLNSGWWT